MLMPTGEAVRKALTRNTAVVVASAPGFPHGVVDHIEDIAKVCRHGYVQARGDEVGNEPCQGHHFVAGAWVWAWPWVWVQG